MLSSRPPHILPVLLLVSTTTNVRPPRRPRKVARARGPTAPTPSARCAGGTSGGCTPSLTPTSSLSTGERSEDAAQFARSAATAAAVGLGGPKGACAIGGSSLAPLLANLESDSDLSSVSRGARDGIRVEHTCAPCLWKTYEYFRQTMSVENMRIFPPDPAWARRRQSVG